MATIGAYSKQAIQVLNDVWVTLNARVTSLLAYKQVQTLAERLELQNRELDAQKNELSAQAVELNQQNTELEMQKKQLSEANRIKTSFISNMSHELRTPLNSIIALSGVLRRRLSRQIPEEEGSYLEVIERNGKNLLELINDILDLSRVDAGREEVEVRSFEVDTLLAEVVSVINPLAKQKNIELVQHPTTGLATVVSDFSKCRHILQNLVGNAVKFTEKGRVEISAQQKGVNIHITVSDTGIGISPNQLPEIFDEFKQVDGSASRKYGGSGLGTGNCEKICRAAWRENYRSKCNWQGFRLHFEAPLAI